MKTKFSEIESLMEDIPELGKFIERSIRHEVGTWSATIHNENMKCIAVRFVTEYDAGNLVDVFVGDWDEGENEPFLGVLGQLKQIEIIAGINSDLNSIIKLITDTVMELTKE